MTNMRLITRTKRICRKAAGVVQNRNGFTLVEVMVAIFLFGLLASGMTTLMAVLIQNNTFSQDMTEATTLAENKMEVFKNSAYSQITTGWGYDMPKKGFWRLWEVKDNTPDAGLKQVTVMVIWFDKKYVFHHVSLLTLKSV